MEYSRWIPNKSSKYSKANSASNESVDICYERIVAKENVENDTLTEPMKRSKNLVKHIEEIFETNKQTDIIEREIATNRDQIQRLQGLQQEREAEKNKTIYAAAILIHQMRNETNQDLDEIFLGEGDQVTERRQTIGELVARIRFMYDTDPMATLTPENRNIVVQFTPTWPN